MKNKIWVLSEIYYPVDTSTGYYMTEIAEAFSQEDLEVHVLTTKLKYTNLDVEMSQKEIRNGVEIHRFTPLFRDKNKSIKRLINALYVSLVLAFKVLFKVSKNDKVFAVTNPIFLVLFLPIVKKLKGFDYTLLVHDVFPENLFAIRKKDKKSLVEKTLKKIFDWGYRLTDKCIVIGRDMEDIISKKRNSSDSVFFIPIWSDNKFIYPKSKYDTNLLKKSSFIDRTIVQFAGNLGYAQGLDFLMEAISQCDFLNLHFLFIGEGALKEKLIRLSEESVAVDVIGYQKRNTQNDFLNASDIALVTLSAGMYGLGVPSKSYNLLAAGKPILLIADKRSEIALLIKEYDIGWVVSPDDMPSLIKTLSLLDNISSDELMEKSIRCRELAESVFAKDQILKSYIQTIV